MNSCVKAQAKWEQKPKALTSRISRAPTQSVLYQVVYEYGEKFQYSYEEHYQQKYGCLREVVKESFNSYLNCGIIRHGCARVVCTECEHTEILAFSCKRRGVCPSCDAKRAHMFAEHLHSNILTEHPHAHAVFSMPKRLRLYFMYDRSLLKHYYKAAWSAWQAQIAEEFPEALTGCIMALHTAGELLNWHPHVHSLCLLGGIANDTFYKLSSVDTAYLTRCFRDNLLAALLAEELIDDTLVATLKSWEHSGFNVWVGETISPSQEDARKFLARYLKKSPVILPRLEKIEKKQETYIRVNKAADSPAQIAAYKDYTALDFLATLSQHIPDLWEQTTRYYGVYSARHRGAKRLAAPQELDPLPEELPAKPSSSWAACKKQVFEIDPLECPKCGAEMKIKEFPQDQRKIEALCKSLNIPSWVPPPKFSLAA